MQAELEASRELLEEFARLAGHDLRAPLRGFQLILEVLREDSCPEVLEEIRPSLDQLDVRAERLHAMLDGILAFARTGREAKLETCNPEAALREVMAGVSASQDGNAALSMELEVQGSSVERSFHRTTLELIAAHLLNNAIQHHDRDEVSIRLVLVPQQDELRLSVEDDGRGIEARHHERIFKPFNALLAKDQGGGVGMGLAVVHKLIQKVGGSISLESPLREGRGSRFTVTLPFG